MSSLADTLLDDGCVTHLDIVHGEPVRVLTGADAGKTFYAVKETEQDALLTTELGNDPRAKRILRFQTSGNVPNLASQDVIETGDGKQWKTMRRPDDGYLTTDFELMEIVSGKDS